MVEKKCRTNKPQIKNKNRGDAENITVKKDEKKKTVQSKTVAKHDEKQLERKKSKKKTNKGTMKERKEKYELVLGKYFIISIESKKNRIQFVLDAELSPFSNKILNMN